MGTSKHIATLLKEEKKRLLFRICGLDQFEFQIKEKIGNDTVRLVRYHQGEETHYPYETKEPLENEVLFSYPADKLVKSTLEAELGLWESIFPSPFSQLIRVFKTDEEISVQTSTPEFLSRLEQLKLTLERLEERATQTELAVLRFHSFRGQFALLIQSSRHRLVHVGFGPELESLCEEFDTGTLTAARLNESLGTSAVFIDIPQKISNFGSLESFTESIQQALGDSKYTLGGLAADAVASGYELGL